MRTMKIFIFIAITMALVISLTTSTTINWKKEVQEQKQTEPSVKSYDTAKKPISSVKRVSRFLAETKNPNAADHCHKDNDVCYEEGKNATTCCNNKCVDLKSDSSNCGACKTKCSYTRTCCDGECVDLSFDKRHCGDCSKKCMNGGYCTYGMCDYA